MSLVLSETNVPLAEERHVSLVLTWQTKVWRSVEKGFVSLLLGRVHSIPQTPLVLLYKHVGSIDNMYAPLRINPETHEEQVETGRQDPLRGKVYVF